MIQLSEERYAALVRTAEAAALDELRAAVGALKALDGEPAERQPC